MNFSLAPTHPDQILRLIARVPSGREVLDRFLTLYRARRVRLESYAPELLARLRAALGEGQPVGACFVNDGDTGVIHFDPGAPLGVLGPFLFHEIVHALDGELWKAARSPRTRAARDELMLEAETRAFAAQHRFTEELRALDPAFDAFLRSQQERVRVLVERMGREEIAGLYGFRH